jgi:DNA invertase Pin-like site-specific DNA recombinase
MIIAYARVSTDDRKLEAQIDALEDAGAKRTYADKATASKRELRPANEILRKASPQRIIADMGRRVADFR